MKYEHKYGTTRKQMRWDEFDYSTPGIYFVTIVTNGRRCLFGDIDNEEMCLNDAGRMLLEQYYELENLYHGILCLDAVIMPNHIHFLIHLSRDSSTSLSEVVWQLKSKTTHLYIHGVKEKNWMPFDGKLWQRSYWDDIVFNEKEFKFIQRYIALNPSRWYKDDINDNHGADIDDIKGCIKKLKTRR